MLPDEARRRRLGAAALALALSSASLAAEDRQWHAVRVGGGVDPLAATAGLPPGLPGWRVLYESARRAHGLWGEDMAPAYVARAGDERRAGGALADERSVPLPLPPRIWRGLLGRPDLAEDRIAAAIVADRRAALLYRGLAGLDEPTLATLAAVPQALDAIRGPAAEAFAAFGARFRVRDGVVLVPGGAGTEPAWQKLVGASPREPVRFLVALLRSHGGRHAFLYDTLAGLDEPHLRFALGLGRPAASRADALAELAAAFDGEVAWWNHAGPAFGRPAADAARLLREVRLTVDGALAPPSSAAFWEGLFARTCAVDGFRPPPKQGPADAAWLGALAARGSAEMRRVRLEQLLFAQRVFGDAPPSASVALAVAIDGLRDARALILALERLGSRDPTLYADGVRAVRAAAEPAGGDRRASGLRAFQAALALLEHACFSGTLDVAEGERLARALFAAAAGGSRAIAAWLESGLLPSLARVVGEPATADAETIVLRGVLGDVADPAAGRAVIEWEGLLYRVDPANAEVRRARRVRERQGGEGLAAALAACRGANPARRDPCGAALDSELVALVYAVHLGDADGPALAGGDPSLRHDLSAVAWSLPEEVFAPGVSWHVSGSLVGLERALAGVALRSRASDELPEHPPVLTAAHVRALAPLAVLADWRELGDGGRDAVAGAIAAGRRRAASLAAGSSDVEDVGRDAGLEPWRTRALEWLLREEPGARDSFFSLGEILLLGARGGALDGAGAWGAGDALTAGLRLRLPGPWPLDQLAGRAPEAALAERFVDLPLRVALHLQERRLPASLGPWVVGRLLPELFSEARPVAPDDRFGLDAWVRGLSTERLDDAVASLAGSGPLQPAPPVREPR